MAETERLQVTLSKETMARLEKLCQFHGGLTKSMMVTLCIGSEYGKLVAAGYAGQETDP